MKIRSTTYNSCGEKVSSATIECGKAKIDIDTLDEFCISIKGYDDESDYFTVLNIPFLTIIDGLISKICMDKLPTPPRNQIAARLELRRLNITDVRKELEGFDQDNYVKSTSLTPMDSKTLRILTILAQNDDWVRAISNLKIIKSAVEDLQVTCDRKLNDFEEQLKAFEKSKLPETESQDPKYEQRYARFFRSVLKPKDEGLSDLEVEKLTKAFSVFTKKP